MKRKVWKYFLNERPLTNYSVPKGFIGSERDDPNGKFGSVSYSRKLTDKEIAEFQLVPFVANPD